MKRLLYISLPIAVFVAVAACESLGFSEGDSSLSARELVGPVWQLIAFENSTGSTPGVGSELLSIIFSNDDGITGRGRYNEFFGSYTAGPDASLSIDVRGSTYAGIPEGSKYLEFSAALDDATSYEIEGDRLRIAYDGKALLLEAEASE